MAYTQAPDFDPEPGSCLLCKWVTKGDPKSLLTMHEFSAWLGSLMVLAVLIFVYPHLMVGPGNLIPGHRHLCDLPRAQ